MMKRWLPRKRTLPVRRPPAAGAVARQTLILSALACRAHLDRAAEHPDAASVYRNLGSWLKKHDLLSAAEPAEAGILTSTQGSLSQDARNRLSWHAEGVAVFARALQMTDFPRHDIQADQFEVTALVGLLQEDLLQILTDATLRSPETLSACRELTYALHFRIREFRRTRAARDFVFWIDPEGMKLLSVETDAFIADGDLSFDGRPISSVAPQALERYERIVRERHRAAIWLIGGEPAYSKVVVDT
jgi:hypothetical protein